MTPPKFSSNVLGKLPYIPMPSFCSQKSSITRETEANVLRIITVWDQKIRKGMAVGMGMTLQSQNVLAGAESLLVLEGNQVRKLSLASR